MPYTIHCVDENCGARHGFETSRSLSWNAGTRTAGSFVPAGKGDTLSGPLPCKRTVKIHLNIQNGRKPY
jgi:hypothetical protein